MVPVRRAGGKAWSCWIVNSLRGIGLEDYRPVLLWVFSGVYRVMDGMISSSSHSEYHHYSFPSHKVWYRKRSIMIQLPNTLLNAKKSDITNPPPSRSHSEIPHKLASTICSAVNLACAKVPL